MLRASFPPAVLFRAANQSWLRVSRKRTTFNTPPQWVGMMSSCDEINLRKQFFRTLDGNPSIGIPDHFPSCASHSHAIGCLVTGPTPNRLENEMIVSMELVVVLLAVVLAMMPVLAPFAEYVPFDLVLDLHPNLAVQPIAVPAVWVEQQSIVAVVGTKAVAVVALTGLGHWILSCCSRYCLSNWSLRLLNRWLWYSARLCLDSRRRQC